MFNIFKFLYIIITFKHWYTSRFSVLEIGFFYMLRDFELNPLIGSRGSILRLAFGSP